MRALDYGKEEYEQRKLNMPTPTTKQHINRRYYDESFYPNWKTKTGNKPGQWVPNHRNWKLRETPGLDAWLEDVEARTGAKKFYDEILTGTNPVCPSMGEVK